MTIVFTKLPETRSTYFLLSIQASVSQFTYWLINLKI